MNILANKADQYQVRKRALVTKPSGRPTTSCCYSTGSYVLLLHMRQSCQHRSGYLSMIEKVSSAIDPELGTDISTWVRETVDELIDPKELLRLNMPTEAYAGRLFEETAFRYLSLHLKNTQELFNPEQTFEVYRRLYPEARVMGYTTGRFSLSGISVPDGLLFDRRTMMRSGEAALVVVYEYTMRNQPIMRQSAYFQKKLHGFKVGRNQHPEVFMGANLRFAVPKDTWIPKEIRRDAKIT